jgi:hypothetical protein
MMPDQPPNIQWVSAWSVGRLCRLRWPLPAHIKEVHLLTGRRVHHWTMLLDQGEEPKPAEDISGYCQAYRNFGYQFSPSFTHIEHDFDNGQWHGIVDRVGEIRGKKTVLEIKNGQPQPFHQVQLAFYTQGLFPQSFLKIQRLAVYLANDGTYKARVYKDPRDYLTVKELLALAEKEHHGTRHT